MTRFAFCIRIIPVGANRGDEREGRRVYYPTRLNGFTGPQVERAFGWARELEKRGLGCLPSRSDDKRPLITYADYWDGGLPSVADLWHRAPSGNIQVMAGRRIVVLDLDGAPGIEQFGRWCDERRYRLPRTWITWSDRHEGRHIWFSLPRGYREPIPTIRPLWGVWDSSLTDKAGRVIGGWKKRHSVELLATRALVMTPPSIHPADPTRVYRWLMGNDPVSVHFPTPLPLWLLSIPRAERPGGPEPIRSPLWRPTRQVVPGDLGLPCRPSDVISAIPDIESLVRNEWGLRIVEGKTGSRGYKDCHDFNRDDRHPSARFRPRDGRFWRAGMGPDTMCLFRLGVEMGRYGSWKEACVDLGRRFLPHLFGRMKDVG